VLPQASTLELRAGDLQPSKLAVAFIDAGVNSGAHLGALVNQHNPVCRV
jgi:hypothetical protein